MYRTTASINVLKYHIYADLVDNLHTHLQLFSDCRDYERLLEGCYTATYHRLAGLTERDKVGPEFLAEQELYRAATYYQSLFVDLRMAELEIIIDSIK